MVNTKIDKENAIEAMMFVIAYERPFSPTTCENFLGLQESLAQDFPSFNKTTGIEIEIQDDAKIHQSEKLSGILMNRQLSDGRPDWSLRAEGNNIIVSCFSYDRWKTESEKATSYLLKVAQSVEKENPIKMLALQTIDKFTDDSGSYKIQSVLNKKSKFLTKHALETGNLWHVHQGWFEASDKEKTLNVLNLSTNEIPEGIVTIIDHLAQFIFETGKSLHQLENDLSTIYNTLHDMNKTIVRELLNKKQKEVIGL